MICQKLAKTKNQHQADIENDVAEFVKRSSELAKVANRSLVAINAAFDSEEQIAANKAELKRIEAITDPKEQNAASEKLQTSQSAAAAKYLKTAGAAEKFKSLSDEKKKSLSKALFNFAVVAIQSPTLIDKGQKIISGASLSNAVKIIPVKDAVPLLQRFVTDGAGTIAGFIKLAKGANIDVPPVDAKSQPDTSGSPNDL